jgi:hypothetical protein
MHTMDTAPVKAQPDTLKAIQAAAFARNALGAGSRCGEMRHGRRGPSAWFGIRAVGPRGEDGVAGREQREGSGVGPKAGLGTSAETFADAARFAEVAVLATLGTGTERALELAGPDDFAGKVGWSTPRTRSTSRPECRSYLWVIQTPWANKCSGGSQRQRS